MKLTRKASTIPIITPTREALKLMDDVRNKWPGRMREAKRMFLLDVGNYMLKAVQERAPEIEIDGKEHAYAQDLRIGILEEGEGQDVIAIYEGSKTATTTLADKGRTVLSFQTHARSPGWVSVLNRYGPWPVEVVPVKVKSGDAKVIARYVRPDEFEALSSRLYNNRKEIITALGRAGAKGAHWVNRDYGVGLSVHLDLGYMALRKELGFDGGSQNSHWRPAFAATKKYAEKCMEKVVKYIETGDRNIFDLPSDTDRIGQDAIKEGSGFSKEIAPFLR